MIATNSMDSASSPLPAAALAPDLPAGVHRQPRISVLRNPDFGFGAWPWARGPLYRLEQEWKFSVPLGDGKAGDFTIPPGYEFDGASVPAWFWGFPFGYTPFGLHIGAALEHDFLCDLGQGGSDWLRSRLGAEYPAPLGSAVTHAHFARRLAEDGLRRGQAWAMAAAVKLFGPRWK